MVTLRKEKKQADTTFSSFLTMVMQIILPLWGLWSDKKKWKLRIISV